MKLVETDRESGAEIYQLTDDPRSADNIYGEQPYGSADGTRITVRFYPKNSTDGGLSILDLTDESLHPVVQTSPRFPAFHAWGEHLYYQEEREGELLLRRCAYASLKKEDVVRLPTEEGRFSYGATSPDHRYYAASVHPEGEPSKVFLMDLTNGTSMTIVQEAKTHFKHEQFSLDGKNRILIQANQIPSAAADASEVRQVFLGILEVDREGVDWLAADRPHTPRPTGHEAWIGQKANVFFSTGADDKSEGNLWTAGVGDKSASLVSKTDVRFGHVSVSRCGDYWLGDATRENGIPIHAGSLETGRHRRLVYSRTVHDGQQWTHTHPYLTADSHWLIFTSDRGGLPQVYGARMPKGFLEDLR